MSEEYRNTNCKYSDAFAFLIKEKGSSTPYKNIALVPRTNIPVTSLTINNGTCPANTAYFGQFNTTTNNSPTNFNGQTKVLKATANITPGITYHIKLVIADHGDTKGLYDSAVFLKAGSFIGDKNLGPDLLLDTKNALCSGSTYTIDATTGTNTQYTWKKNGIVLSSASNQPTYTVDYSDPGYYEVDIELDSGCKLKGHVTIEQQEIPRFSSVLEFDDICDDQVDGWANVYFANYSQRIITNMSQSYNVKYFKDLPTDINSPDFSLAINQIRFNTPQQKVWIWVKPGNCDPYLEEITLKKQQKSIPNSFSAIPICDDQLKNAKTIDLKDYQNTIANNIVGIPRYYNTLRDAQLQQNALPSTTIQLSTTAKPNYFIRYHQANRCDDIQEMQFNFKQGQMSKDLKNVTVCRNTLAPILKAGPGFDSYEWSYNNLTTPSITDVPVGVYTVKLGSNSCFYTQTVEVIEAPTASITQIDIAGFNVTVTAAGGTPPYLFAIDNDAPSAFTPNTIFKNIPIGNHRVYVKSNDGCETVYRDFSIINIPNVISPNSDGINDVIDLSDLLNKTDSHFRIYDRLGRLVFEGNTANHFIWDGKQNGRVLPTGSYWYIADWIEPTSGKLQQIKNWILLKNY